MGTPLKLVTIITAMAEAAAPAKKDFGDRPKNNVRVGSQKSKFLYADVSKHLLHDGEKEVIISGLGQAIGDAVAVAEMLKNQGMVTVTRINTSRGEEESARRRTSDKIEITVVKTKEFDSKYSAQQAQREEKKASRDSQKESK